MAYWLHIIALVWANICSSKGFVPDDTKPLLKSMLAYKVLWYLSEGNPTKDASAISHYN